MGPVQVIGTTKADVTWRKAMATAGCMVRLNHFLLVNDINFSGEADH